MIEKPVQLGNQQMGSTVKDNSMDTFLGNTAMFDLADLRLWVRFSSFPQALLSFNALSLYCSVLQGSLSLE